MSQSGNWQECTDTQLQSKLWLAGQVIGRILIPAREQGDPRAEGVLNQWEEDRLGIIAEMRKRGLLEDQTVSLNTLELSARRLGLNG